MAIRNIYLKIERIPDYSPVEPDDHVSPPIKYRRDCMRNMGHEDGTIPDDEVAARRLTALIYREYLITCTWFQNRIRSLLPTSMNLLSCVACRARLLCQAR
jgi:hypothetical protein